jgi:hypothetical protein
LTFQAEYQNIRSISLAHGRGLERQVFLGDYVGVEEAARLSGLHPNSIRRLLRAGRLSGRKGRWRGRTCWMVSRRSLREYVQTALTFASDRRGPRMFLKRWRDE